MTSLFENFVGDTNIVFAYGDDKEVTVDGQLLVVIIREIECFVVDVVERKVVAMLEERLGE